MKKTILYRLPVIAYCAFIFLQSSSAVSLETLPTFPHADKVLHFCGYALLGFLLARMLAHETLTFSRRNLMIAAMVLSTLYGASDEFHQSFVAERSADVFDVVADGVGSVAGVIVYAWVQYAWSRKST